MDPMELIQMLLGGGSGANVSGVTGARGSSPMAQAGQPNFAPPPPQQVQSTTPQPGPTGGGAPAPGPAFEQMGRMGASPGPVPGQVPGQGTGAQAAGAGNPAQGGGGFDLAALQALEAPESENPGPPSPPGAPARPQMDPGMLFEALMRLGVHPGQIPQLSQQLKG